MKRATTTLLAAVLAAATWVAGPTPPAGAAVTVTSSGTTITATVTGGGVGTVGLSCVAGQARVLNVAATPSLTCGAVTAVTVTTDNFSYHFGAPYPAASFPALTTSTVTAGSGFDVIELSAVRDIVNLGAGGSQVTVPWGGADDTVSFVSGTGGDRVEVFGTPAGNVGSLTSPGTGMTRLTSGTWDATFTGARIIDIDLGDGSDALGAATLPASSQLELLVVDGGLGNDLIVCGHVRCTINGGAGTNTLTGGSATDSIGSTSTRDTIRGNGSSDGVSDLGPRAFGGRTITTSGTGSTGDHYLAALNGDAYMRGRAAGATGATVWAALARTGRQDLDGGIAVVRYFVHQSPRPLDRVVVDVTPLSTQAQVVDGASGTALDIVVPSGSWTHTAGTVSFSGGYQPISYSGSVAVLVRGPFTNANESYAHRLIRDLYLRLPTAAERTALRDQLNGGSTTRAQAVAARTTTDGYRGLIVDRAFVDVLRRTTDLSGRDYWVGRLGDGLVTRRLRANLYGSPEYVSRSGGTNRTFVEAAYADILGRAPTESDIDFWVGQIVDAGLPRGTVADRFLNTPEARRVVIRDLFFRWALREPTDAEVTTWLPQLGSSSTDGELALVRSLAASTTYFTRPDV